MPSYIPISISRPKPYLLTLSWDDGFQSTISLESFREECPCALCKGETIMGTTYIVGIKQLSPGMNELLSLEPVGNYGVQAKWNDNHDSGIYTWEALRTIAIKHKLSESRMDEMQKREAELQKKHLLN